MSTHIDLPNGNKIKFEPNGTIQIQTGGSDAADFQIIQFRGIKKNLISGQTGEILSTEVLQINGRMDAHGVGEILTPDEMLTLADLIGKVADSTDGFKEAKQDEIERLKNIGQSIVVNPNSLIIHRKP